MKITLNMKSSTKSGKRLETKMTPPARKKPKSWRKNWPTNMQKEYSNK